jgi:hypothetical protein
VKPSVSDYWSDAEVLERMKTAPLLPDAVFILGSKPCGNVIDLCSDTVVKKCLSSTFALCPEALALNFVRSHTSIPVPFVRRFITSESGFGGYILLEKIEGKRLDQVWPSLSPLQKFLVAWTLRGYIRELRRASNAYSRCHVPGPMGDAPRRCRDPEHLFGLRPRGPFESSANLIAYFNKGPGKATVPRLKDIYPLVLNHNDLSMRNIIVGLDGKIWLVDWEYSGFYPPWFEYITMMNTAENDGDKAPKSWWNYIPFVTGMWAKEERMFWWYYRKPR